MTKQVNEKQQHDPKHVKMAVGIASDPRHKGGDYTGAHNKIEKIAKGLASHPQVAAVLKKQNEAIKEADKKFDPLKHVKNPTKGEKDAAKDVKRGSYADRAAMLKSAEKDGRLKEGLGELAHAAEMDHEVQMARAELYKLAKYSIKLHDMLKGISEAEGLEGWVQSKITKAAADIGSVYHHLDYQESEANMPEMPEMAIEGKYKNNAQRKAVHAAKDEKKNEYKESLRAKLYSKLGK